MKCLKIILLVSLSACSILIHPEKSASSEIGRNAVSAMLRKELSLVPSVAEVIPPSGFMGDAVLSRGSIFIEFNISVSAQWMDVLKSGLMKLPK